MGPEYPNRLLEVTHAVRYNPNCPKCWEVRLVGPEGRIDGKVLPFSRDVFGWGETLEEACDQAFRSRDVLRKYRKGASDERK